MCVCVCSQSSCPGSPGLPFSGGWDTYLGPAPQVVLKDPVLIYSRGSTRRTSSGSPCSPLCATSITQRGPHASPPLQYTCTSRYPSLFAPGRNWICFVTPFSLSRILWGHFLRQDFPRGHLWTESESIGLPWAVGPPAPCHSSLRHSQVLSVVVSPTTVVIEA